MTIPRRSKRARRQKLAKAAGASRSKLAAQNPVPLDSDKLRQLYTTMLGCRMAAERARSLVKEGRLSADLGAATGTEAAEVGALIDLLADDCVAPGRRDLIAFFIRGTPLRAVFAQLYARQAGPNGRGLTPNRSHFPQSMVAPAFAVSAQLNLVTGVAWSLKRHGKPSVAVAFSGDDSASLGFWRDAVYFSAAHKLPIVHIVHNNAGDGSVGARLSRPAHDSANMQPSIPAFTVDGNDVVAVYRVAQEAIRRARQGHGPALIECQTYRWGSQLETDSSSRRSGAEALDQSTDPIARMEAYLEQKRLWSDKWKHRLAERLSQQLDKAVEAAGRSWRRPQDQNTQQPGAETEASQLATAS
jgi:pyruvate dehydrogenase E1 component alpha subunit